MAPTVFKENGFRFFFFFREEARPHVHVSHPDGEAKFWISPEVNLAMSSGLSFQQIRAVEKNGSTTFGGNSSCLEQAFPKLK